MERNRINSAKHYKKLRALSKIGAGLPHWNVDILRRVLVEVPPELGTENERLAYFRGFMAGTKRNAEETARFERLKDLPHRIASERSSQRGIGYEEAVSAAYEGLLVFMRKRELLFASVEKERRYAAKAIRNAIIDYKRSEGPTRARGGARWIGMSDSFTDEGESLVEHKAVARDDAGDGAELWNAVEDRLAAHEDGDRLLYLLRARAEGEPLKAVGARLGITESRACQILKEERPWLEEHLGPLLGLSLADTSVA